MTEFPTCPIIFDEPNHTYTHTKTKERYISVTTLLDRYKPKFDLDYWSEKKAKQRNISKEEIIAEWKEINRISKERGTRIHKLLEVVLKFKMVPKYEDRDQNEELLAYVEYLNKLKLDSYGNKLFIEKLLWDEQYSLAGTCDLLIINDNGISILDWKTNSKLRKEGYGQRLTPLESFNDGEFDGYSLQLSAYAYMASKLLKLPVHKLSIVWFTKEKIELMPVEYHKDAVDHLLIYHYLHNKPLAKELF